MAKIAEVVKLKSGYTNFVELKSAFGATQENADRMAMYRPTRLTAWLLNASAGDCANPMTRNSIGSAAHTERVNRICV